MDTLIKEYRLRNPEQDINKYIRVLNDIAKDNIWYKKSSANLVNIALIEANNEDRIRAWYDKQGTLIGIIMFDISYVWWTYSKVLSEETVLCLEPSFKGFQRIAMKELEVVARENHCDFICTGNLVSTKETSQAIANGYKRHGKYDHEYSMFIKEIKYEE